MCISACPVKSCMNGSGNHVEINHDLCIGCGKCITACQHDARNICDDFDLMMESLKKGEEVLAIAAPAVAANFPGQYKNFFGWVKSLGVKAIFDVSFGAELTVKSYVNYINDTQPEMVIAQPCPAIVSYIETFQPELIPYLAPADSPMLHIMKMIREYYPEYSHMKILALSPCLAKKREFADTGIGDFNVTYKSFAKYIETNNINLAKYPEEDFINPPAERAVLFSSPGGLMRTVERETPEIMSRIRRIEGPDIVYEYMKKLPDLLKKGMNPLLIDCLNCEMGCNGGPGTLNQEKAIDEVEYYIEKRMKEAKADYSTRNISEKKRKKLVNKVLDKYWYKELYHRGYQDKSALLKNYKIPDSKQLDAVYKEMKKTKEEDYLQCASCGYNSCEAMAEAIFNGLNKPGNCHDYREKAVAAVTKEYETIYCMITNLNHIIQQVQQATGRVVNSVHNQTAALVEFSSAIEEMTAGIQNISRISSERDASISEMANMAKTSEEEIKETIQAITQTENHITQIGEMMEMIENVASRTNILSMNASIEAAHAGEAGKGFSVVAEEIKKLAEAAGESTQNVEDALSKITSEVRHTVESTENSEHIYGTMINGFMELTGALHEMIGQLNEMSAGSRQTVEAIYELRELNSIVDESAVSINSAVDDLNQRLGHIAEISQTSMHTISELTGMEFDHCGNE